ncbi:MAG: response regulator [Lachnospiraceae bacterium]|nr:response regulator [Lachnospiraceae bacterium]
MLEQGLNALSRFNASYSVAAVLFGAVLSLFLFIRYPKADATMRAFRKFVLATTISAVLEIVANGAAFYSQDLPTWFVMFSNMISGFGTATCSYFLVSYVYSYVKDMHILPRIINNIILITSYILQLLNLRFHFYYYVDEAKNFVHEKHYVYGVYFISLYFIIFASVVLIIYRKAYQPRSFNYIMMSAAAVSVMILIQTTQTVDMMLTYFTALLGSFILFLTLETPDYYKLMDTIDALERSKEETEHAREDAEKAKDDALAARAEAIESQREAEKAREDAVEASNAKSDFLANMSHEIRTPMNTILGMDEMILRESRDQNVVEYAQNIQHAGNTLLQIINDILDLSKIESGKMEVIAADYHLSEVVHDVSTMVRMKIKEKNLDFFYDVDESLPDTLLGDEVRLKQVLINILNNAAKYTKIGHVHFTVEGERTIKNDLPYIRLRFIIEDTGIGIKDEDMDKLYHTFERLDLDKNRDIEGTGLGLAITNEIVKLMGGKLLVSSVYEKGTTFTVELSQQILGETTISEYAQDHRGVQEVYENDFIAPDASILAVDDNEMNLVVVMNLLKGIKSKVTVVKSGFACLEKMKKEHFDIIFLDHMMPEMDGIETLHQIHDMDDNKCEGSPIIVLTANAIAGMKEMYMNEGFVDYLSKPVRGEELEAMVKKHLDPALIIEKGRDGGFEEAPRRAQLNEVEAAPAVEQGKDEDDQELISKSDGMVFFGNNERLYFDVVKMFVGISSEKRDELIRAFDERDWKNYTIYVHALKSSSRNIGANALYDFARRMESAGNQTENEKNREISEKFIDANHDKLIHMYMDTVEQAKKLMEK